MLRHLIALTSAVALITLSASLARAEDTGGAADTADVDDARAEARRLFERGLELVDQERWEDALEAFDGSLELYPTQTALYNRALCYGLAGRPVDAVRDLEAHLERYGETVDAERRAAVEAELERQRRRVGRVAIRVEGADAAAVSIDGVEVGRTPLDGPLLVNPGRHQVTVTADGFDPVSRWVEVGSGDETALVLAMIRTTSEPPRGAITPPPETPTPRRVDTGRGLRIGGYVLSGVAVAALGAALGLFLWNDSEFETWQGDRRDALIDRLQNPNGEDPDTLAGEVSDYNADGDRITTIDAVCWAMLGLGAAATVAGVVMLVLGLRQRPARPSVSLLPSLGGLSLSGAF